MFPCEVCSTSALRRAALAAGAVLATLAASLPARAQSPDPTGQWLVEHGLAVIRVVDCNGRLWGVVSWEKYPGTDRYNPDPPKRNRPTLGMPTLIDLQRVGPNEWDGEVYNSNDGKTYSAKISLAGANVLRVRGCVLGFLCGGEDWTRVPASHSTAGAAVSAQPSPSADDLCSTLTRGAGAPHPNRLK